MSELCRRFGVSRGPGLCVAWPLSGGWSGGLGRGGPAGRIRAHRAADPRRRRRFWRFGRSTLPGAARKIERVLRNTGEACRRRPRRSPRISAPTRQAGRSLRHEARAFARFEQSEPNELWQMDFKGHFPLSSGRCHPLTVLDDHSRYALALEACANEQTQTVPGAAEPRLQALRSAAPYSLRQRLSMGNRRQLRGGTHAERLADGPRCRRHSRPTVSSPDPGQGRAVSPNAEAGSDQAEPI